MFISGKACSVNNLGRKHRGNKSDSGSDGNTGMLNADASEEEEEAAEKEVFLSEQRGC